MSEKGKTEKPKVSISSYFIMLQNFTALLNALSA
jgi:hypothetical protein